MEGSDFCYSNKSDFMNASFGFCRLGIEDESRAFFKCSDYIIPDYEDSEHLVLHGLSFRWSNKDKADPRLNCREEEETTTEVLNLESKLSYEELPIFLVQVRGGLIDSEVPNFQMDVANQTRIVNWRALYTNYFYQYLAGVRQNEKVSARRIATKAAVFVGN